MHAEDRNAETILEQPDKKSRCQTVTNAQRQIKKNDQQQQEIRFQPASQKVHPQKFEGEEKKSQDCD